MIGHLLSISPARAALIAYAEVMPVQVVDSGCIRRNLQTQQALIDYRFEDHSGQLTYR